MARGDRGLMCKDTMKKSTVPTPTSESYKVKEIAHAQVSRLTTFLLSPCPFPPQHIHLLCSPYPCLDLGSCQWTLTLMRMSSAGKVLVVSKGGVWISREPQLGVGYYSLPVHFLSLTRLGWEMCLAVGLGDWCPEIPYSWAAHLEHVVSPEGPLMHPWFLPKEARPGDEAFQCLWVPSWLSSAS